MDVTTCCPAPRLPLRWQAVLFVSLTAIVYITRLAHQSINPSTWRIQAGSVDVPGARSASESGVPVGKPVCTPAVFRNHYAEEGYFPSGSGWVGKDKAARYEPDICRFRPLSLKAETLKTCLSRKKIKSIVVLGASQGKKYSVGFSAQLNNIFSRYELLKIEAIVDRTHEAAYFADGDQYILERLSPQPRHCGGCEAFKERFYEEDGTQSVLFEYLGMDDLLDSTLRLFVREAREKSIEIHQEFLFRHYLARDPPDLVIISPALNHQKFKSSPEKFAADFKYFRSLIQIYLPPTTRTLWMPGLSERENANASNPEQYKNRRVDGLLASEAIDRLNHVLYDILAPDLLTPDGLVLGFLDMVRVSDACPQEWWPSRVHLEKVFYRKISAHVLEFFCGDI